jgi:hypothetical protein
MTIWRMYIACWIPKSTNTLLHYVIIIAFPLQQWLHERASLLRYAYFACLVLKKVSASQCQQFLSAYLKMIRSCQKARRLYDRFLMFNKMISYSVTQS